MSKQTQASEEANPYYKPGVREQLEQETPLSDFHRAVVDGDVEKVKELVQKRRLHTYDAELEARGIDRDSDEYRNAFSYALMWLLDKRPFYGYMFDEIVRRESMEIDTLCVLIRNGRIEMWYNPDFLAIHKLSHNVGFLQHEMGHVAHGHLQMQKRLPPDVLRDRVFAVAIDLAVDSLIQNEGDQPPWVLLPSMLRVPDPSKPEDQWTNFKERQTWEYYYRMLKDMQEKFPDQFQKQVVMVVTQRPQSGQPQGGSGESGDQEGGQGQGEEGQGQGEDQLPGQRNPWSKDDHRAWELQDTDNADMQEEVVKQTLKAAYDKASRHEKNQMRGYMPGELLAMIEELFKEKAVPFERVFRAFVGSHLQIGKRHTMVKLSRRRKVPPGHTFERRLVVLFALDDSGSVGDEEAALMRSELHHASQMSGVTILVQRFTFGLNGPLVNLDEADFKRVQDRYSGGTDFEAVTKLADEITPDLLLIGTDGYAPTPTKPKCPVGWILTHNGQEHPWGMTIRMPSVDEIKRGYKASIERWL